MGPHASRNVLTWLFYHLSDVLLRMPGNGDPESGERLQVGGGHSWLGLVEAEYGSRVLICQPLDPGSGCGRRQLLVLGTQQVMHCKGGFLTFLWCAIGNVCCCPVWSYS